MFHCISVFSGELGTILQGESYSHSASQNRKMWSQEAMERALQATSEGMSVREAATQFGVPKSTLHNCISGRVQPGAAPGYLKS